MKIGYIGGFWATNIGNSAYNLGSLHLLSKLIGEENVFFLNDPPAHFWNEGGKNPKKAFDFLSRVSGIDLVLVSGPVLSKQLPLVYGETFSALAKRGIKVGFISAGLSAYDSEEASIVRDFFQKFPPYVIITRDYVSYRTLKEMDLDLNIFNGICTGFYIGEAARTVKLDMEPYIVYNFARRSEPVFCLRGGEIAFRKRRIIDRYPKTLDGNLIVRTVSEIFRYFDMMIFNRPNVYYSDLPQNYFSIYKNSELVLSERVHTCVATLSLGGRAMYISHTKRSMDGRRNLLHRVGLSEIYERPVSLDFDLLSEEKLKIENFLKTNI